MCTCKRNGNALTERHMNSYTKVKTDETRSYTYDALGRLNRSVRTDSISGKKSTSSYSFDATSNMRIETDDGVDTYSYYNGLGQLTLKQGGKPASTYNYRYDANGNQITEKLDNNGITTFNYDVENRLSSVYKQDRLINANAYNSSGQRIKKLSVSKIE